MIKMINFIKCSSLTFLNLANVLLSLDETYADIQPVRRDPGSTSAFVLVLQKHPYTIYLQFSPYYVTIK